MTTAWEKADQYLRDQHIYRYNGQFYKADRLGRIWSLHRVEDQNGKHVYEEGSIEFFSLSEEHDFWRELWLGRRDLSEPITYTIDRLNFDLAQFEHIGPALEAADVRLLLSGIYKIGEHHFKAFQGIRGWCLLLVGKDGEAVDSLEPGELWGYFWSPSKREERPSHWLRLDYEPPLYHWYQLIWVENDSVYVGSEIVDDEVNRAEFVADDSEEYRVRSQFLDLMSDTDW